MKKLLLSFLASALEPLASLALRRGIKIQEFMEAAKGAFVAAAERELNRKKNEATISKLALMTGLQRRDVKRITEGREPSSAAVHTLTKVLGQWHHDRRYAEKGKPRALSHGGARSEFAGLVASVSKDLSPYSVLFELERMGIIERRRDTVRPLSQTVEMSKDMKRALDLLAQDFAHLSTGVEENIFSRNEIPNLHITTRYDNICVDRLPEIRRWMLKKGAELHSEARKFLSRFDKDLNPALFEKQGGAEVVLGSFSKSLPPEEDEERDA